MTTIQRVSRTELARNTRQVLNDVQRGRTALVESHGKPEAAILDIIDYRIVRGVMRYHAEDPEIDPEAGLSEGAVQAREDAEARYALVLAHYLAGSISMSRAGELLGIPWLELRTRFMRLDVPVRTAPADADEAADDVAAAESFTR